MKDKLIKYLAIPLVALGIGGCKKKYSIGDSVLIYDHSSYVPLGVIKKDSAFQYNSRRIPLNGELTSVKIAVKNSEGEWEVHEEIFAGPKFEMEKLRYNNYLRQIDSIKRALK